MGINKIPADILCVCAFLNGLGMMMMMMMVVSIITMYLLKIFLNDKMKYFDKNPKISGN